MFYGVADMDSKLRGGVVKEKGKRKRGEDKKSQSFQIKPSDRTVERRKISSKKYPIIKNKNKWMNILKIEESFFGFDDKIGHEAKEVVE